MSSREVGMGLGPIWWSTVQEYCEKNEFDEEQIEAAHHHVKEMDTLYLQHMRKKQS